MSYARTISVLAMFACLPASLMCDQPSFDGGEAAPPFDCFGTPCNLSPSSANDTCCLVDGGGSCQPSKDSPGCNVFYCGPQLSLDPDGSDLSSDSGPCVRAPYTFSCMRNADCKPGFVCCLSDLALSVNVACSPGCSGDDYSICDSVADCPDGGSRCVPIALQGTMVPFKVCK